MLSHILMTVMCMQLLTPCSACVLAHAHPTVSCIQLVKTITHVIYIIHSPTIPVVSRGRARCARPDGKNSYIGTSGKDC